MQYSLILTMTKNEINRKGADLPISWYAAPPNGYPMSTPKAIPPNASGITRGLSSLVNLLAKMHIPLTAIAADELPWRALASRSVPYEFP